MRAAIIEAVDERARRFGPSGGLQANGVLTDASAKIAGTNRRLTSDEEQALLVAFYDLFRTGHLCWGFNLANASPPFFHVSEQGRRALEHLSRDPMNPDGYRAYLAGRVTLNPIAGSYVDEALLTYNANCYRAAAVMIGAAAESLLLELRDTVDAAMKKVGRRSANINNSIVSRVIEAVRKELEMQRAGMPHDLREEFEAFWPAMTQQIRSARNDAGHPATLDPVTPERVHAALLMFPELADLTSRLRSWVSAHYRT